MDHGFPRNVKDDEGNKIDDLAVMFQHKGMQAWLRQWLPPEERNLIEMKKNKNNGKSLKIVKTNVFLQHGKDAHRDSAKGALNDSSRSLIWNFLEQIVFLKICEKVSKVSKLDQFWVQAVDQTTRLRRVIGCLQTR